MFVYVLSNLFVIYEIITCLLLMFVDVQPNLCIIHQINIITRLCYADRNNQRIDCV